MKHAESIHKTTLVASTVFVASTSLWCAPIDDTPYCGDGIINGVDEFCDGDVYRGEPNCRSNGFVRGVLSCGFDCRFDTSRCESDETGGAPPMCGNGIFEAGEECDLEVAPGQDCERLDLGMGEITCAPDCTLDTSNCSDSGCGDGVCVAPETCSGCPQDCGPCDPGACGDNVCDGDETCDSCPQDCEPCPHCGDNVCEAPEVCGTCPSDCGECPCPDANYWTPSSITQTDWTGQQSNQTIDVGIEIEVRESGSNLEVRVCKPGDMFMDDVAFHIEDPVNGAYVDVANLATANSMCSAWTGLVNDGGYLEADTFEGSWQLVSPAWVADHWSWPSNGCVVNGEPWGTCWYGAGLAMTRTCKGL